MIQQETRLAVADNTGAKELLCIQVMGSSNKKYAAVGDVITATVKEASPNMTVKKSEEAVEEIIPQAVRAVHGSLGNRKIHYDMPDELLLVPMDATLIIQTISNILGNAIKHTNDDGNIWIQVWNSGKNAVFRFSNDGAQIMREDLPHLFDAYYRGADSSQDGGIGLGLSICKLIVTAHGGAISAYNGDGVVTFEFTLPMEDNDG